MSPRCDPHPLRLLLIFLHLGLTAFGGPVAHLSYFRQEFVLKRRWLSEAAYGDLVALCQFLPGPASSQVGMALGLLRGGYAGALAAWLGFTLPSALGLMLLALGLGGDWLPAGALHGLKVVAVAVVAQAVWGMARQHCPDRLRQGLMGGAAGLLLLLPGPWTPWLVLLLGGLLGWRWLPPMTASPVHPLPGAPSRRAGLLWLSLFALLLVTLPLLASLWPEPGLARLWAFYRTGALVFGGGHVVLPLLQGAVVDPGWVAEPLFLAGYGAAQAVPGPLFTFAAFLGAAMTGAPNGLVGGLLCLLAIFAPAWLLLAGSLPFWVHLRQLPWARGLLAGVNAAVVGLLLAALYDPVWRSAILAPADLALALLALLALTVGRQPPWRVVVGCAVLGALMAKLV
ncbi:chromate efflux transporter [Pseudaeromonas paramecii]|uniref:Chromate efflux transporter n=1 Tax=Pseudaeromonas paramecii TaxID=2138166 RepID=A0ABP8QCK6_9GAMM